MENVIVVRRSHEEVNWTDQDVSWDEIRTKETSFETKQTNGNDPFMIIYTSGTTGKPKGALHTHNGFPLKSAFDAGICMDVCKRDTLFGTLTWAG
ncbi:AMP-binding protein [Piscibacillus salipiscarius]|uniref:AMP-binding protein n=1 Tax=Piscibacillus salipiscarius TaxID=299480 RepID=UPI0034E2C220